MSKIKTSVRAVILASLVSGSILLVFGIFAYSDFLKNSDKLDMDFVKCYEVLSNDIVMTCYGRYVEWYDFREVPLYHVDKYGVRYSVEHRKL